VPTEGDIIIVEEEVRISQLYFGTYERNCALSLSRIGIVTHDMFQVVAVAVVVVVEAEEAEVSNS